MAWIGQNIFSYAQALVTGYTVNCPESPDTVMNDLREIGPTYYFAPPRVFEGMLTQVMIRMEDASALKRKLFHAFMGVARRVGGRILDRQAVGVGDRLLYGLGNLCVFGPLRNVLGLSRVRVAYTAGEAIGPDLFTFYRSIGINLKQLYGSTETAVFVCIQPDGQVKADTVGPPVPGVELRIEPNGEILIRSPGLLKEYYKNPQATAEVKDAQGWYHTGDAGYLDADGHLKIIDRANDVGKLADGTLFAPKYIENKLKFFPYIKEAVAFGNQRERVCVFINIDFEAVGNWAEKHSLPYAGYVDLAEQAAGARARRRVRREGQCRSRGRRHARQLADPPLPRAAQGARSGRRRAHAHAQGAAALHPGQVRGAGRGAVLGQDRAVHRDAGQVRGRALGRRHATLPIRMARSFPRVAKAA